MSCEKDRASGVPPISSGRIGKAAKLRHAPSAVRGTSRATATGPDFYLAGKACAKGEPKSEDRPEAEGRPSRTDGRSARFMKGNSWARRSLSATKLHPP